MRIKVEIILLLLLNLIGCDTKSREITTQIKQQAFNDKLFSEKIRHFLDEFKSFPYEDTINSKLRLIIVQLYEKSNFKPLLITNFDDTERFERIIEELQNSYKHGIPQEIFSSNELVHNFQVSLDTTLAIEARYYHLAKAEVLGIKDFLLFTHLVINGLVNPINIYPEDYNMPYKKADIKDLVSILINNNIDTLFARLENLPESYLRLKNYLEKFYKLKNTTWKELPLPKKKIKPGEPLENQGEIILRLHTLGFLDTNTIKISDIKIYDSALVKPLMNFQRFHGISEDGVIGKNTIEKLNLLPITYYEIIKINLEKLRWYDIPDTGKLLIVNIPEFYLHAYENSRLKFSLKICVGRKKDWQTPILFSRINEIILNPEWNVPESIIKEEIINNLKKDSNYLLKKKFRIYQASTELSPSEISVNSLQNEKYRLVQSAGPGNALGRIKFNFKNPFDIYLHDTPEKSKFNLNMRAISHGCVRLEKPLMLVEFILENNSPWKIDYVKYEIGEKVSDKNIIREYRSMRKLLKQNFNKKSTFIKLKSTVPILVTYQTAFVDENGNLNIRDDIYTRDNILSEKIKTIENMLIHK